jgi:hypothetical protein
MEATLEEQERRRSISVHEAGHLTAAASVGSVARAAVATDIIGMTISDHRTPEAAAVSHVAGACAEALLGLDPNPSQADVDLLIESGADPRLAVRRAFALLAANRPTLLCVAQKLAAAGRMAGPALRRELSGVLRDPQS